MRRRRFLAALAANAGLAGCLTAGSGVRSPTTPPPDTPSTDARTTDEPTDSASAGGTASPVDDAGTPTTTAIGDATVTEGDAETPVLSIGETFVTSDGREVTLARPAVRPIALGHEYVSSTHTYIRPRAAPEGEQFLLAAVSRSGFDDGGLIELPMAARVDGETHADGRRRLGRDTGGRRGKLGVAVPVAEADSAALVWQREDGPSPRWRVPGSVLPDLAAAPRYELRSVSFPDSVRHGETVEVSVAFANVGDRDGRLPVSIDVRQGSLPLEDYVLSIPAGGSVSRTVEVSPYWSDGVESLRLIVDWGRDRRDSEVQVVGGGEDDGTDTATPRPVG